MSVKWRSKSDLNEYDFDRHGFDPRVTDINGPGSACGFRVLTRWIVCFLVGSGCVFAQATDPKEPIGPADRVEWFLNGTLGPASLLAGLASAGWGTIFDTPREYGTHWEGYIDRYGMRFSGVASSNAIEDGLGAIWQEDPRYFRAGSSAPFKQRVGRVIKWTFVARNGKGQLTPAYARYIAIPTSNFLSNTWREPSEADATHALERTLAGFLGRLAGNTWGEFWPDVRSKLFHKN